jgi:hypothetical protein
MSNVFKIYIVKSFGPEEGSTNLKAFVNFDEAEAYHDKIREQIPEDSDDEFIYIEEMDCLSDGTTNRSVNLSFMPATTETSYTKVDLSFIPL